MKKFIALTLTFLMAMFALAGCGGSGGGSSDGDTIKIGNHIITIVF